MIPNCLNVAIRKEKLATKNSAEAKSLGDLGDRSRLLLEQRGGFLEAVDLAKRTVLGLAHFEPFHH